MANRHCHKKRRAEVRARMEATGESYQTALARLASDCKRDRHPLLRSVRAPWLLHASYFGIPVTVAIYELLSRASVILVSGCGGLFGLPLAKASPLHVCGSDVS